MGPLIFASGRNGTPAPPEPVVIIHDTFTDTNGTALPSHAPEVGGPWTAVAPIQNLSVQGNAAQPTLALICNNAIEAAVDIDATFTFVLPDGVINNPSVLWIEVRQTPSTSWIVTGVGADGSLAATEVPGGLIASPGWDADGAEHTFRIVLNGSSLQIYLDDELKIDATTTILAGTGLYVRMEADDDDPTPRRPELRELLVLS